MKEIFDFSLLACASSILLCVTITGVHIMASLIKESIEQFFNKEGDNQQ